MEDAHACILDLKPEGDTTGPADEKTRISFFGVYDGHGGDKVAIYTGENLHKIVAKQEAFKQQNFDQALKDGFLATDRAILSGPFVRWLPCAIVELSRVPQIHDTRTKSLAAPPPLAS